MAGYQPRHDTDPVWFNGQQVNALTYVSAQVGVLITAVYGWDDRPDVRDTRENRAGDDGEWADNLFLGGRTITVEGEVMGSSWVNLQSRKRSLAAIFNPTSDEVLFKIPDPATASPTGVYADSGMTGYERVYCRVIEAIQFGDTLDPMCQTWQVVLRASDPRIYSDTETSTDSGTSGTAARTATVDQGGTYDTPPIITVTAPTSSEWSVADNAGALSIPISGLTLTGTDTVTINVSERTISWSSTYLGPRLALSSPSIVALWMLDETSGTTADNAEGTASLDGTYSGTYGLNAGGPYAGMGSVDLNGSTGYVSLPNVAALYDGTLLECWIYFDSLSGTQTIIDSFSSNKGYRIQWDGSKFVTSIGKATGTEVSTSMTSYQTIATGTWYRLTFCPNISFGSPTSKLYIDDEDGVPVAEVSRAFTGSYSKQTASGARIGSTVAGANFFNGRVAAFGVYDAHLLDATDLNYVHNELPAEPGVEFTAYQYLDAASARWANLGTASSTYTLSSSGLYTGSKLNVSYRDARL